MHLGLCVPGTLELEVIILALKRWRRRESVSTNLGLRDKYYYREIKREEGIREGFLEENAPELRFEGGGGRCQPEKEGLACMLGVGSVGIY